MKKFGGILLLVAATTLGGLPAQGLAGEQGPVLDKVKTTWGTPYDVSLQRTEQGVTIAGKVRGSLARTGRRMYGRVWAELVDRFGETIAVHYGDPRRLGVAKHTYRALFTIEIDRLPESTAAIRVGYR